MTENVLRVGRQNCYVSEMTIAELHYGYAFGQDPRNKDDVKKILQTFKCLAAYDSFPIFAETKAGLRRTGKLIEDFDILIGATALYHNMVMVTDNTEHFQRIPNLEIENWVERPQKNILIN